MFPDNIVAFPNRDFIHLDGFFVSVLRCLHWVCWLVCLWIDSAFSCICTPDAGQLKARHGTDNRRWWWALQEIAKDVDSKLRVVRMPSALLRCPHTSSECCTCCHSVNGQPVPAYKLLTCCA